MSHSQSGPCNLRTLFKRLKCICIPCTVDSTQSDCELFDFAFKKINDENQEEDEIRHLFGHSHVSPGEEYTTNTTSLSALERNYEKFLNRNLQEDDPGNHLFAPKTPIFRNCPINWEDLRTLNLRKPIRPDGEICYQEVSTASAMNLENLEETSYYNRVIKRNLMFSFFVQSCRHQQSVMGFFKGPQGYASISTDDDFIHGWKTNLDWINSIESLPKFVADLQSVGSLEFAKLLGFYKGALEKFQQDVRLHDFKYWLDDADEGRKYVTYLRTNAAGMHMLAVMLYNCVLHTWQRLKDVQVDFAKLLDIILEKFLKFLR